MNLRSRICLFLPALIQENVALREISSAFRNSDHVYDGHPPEALRFSNDTRVKRYLRNSSKSDVFHQVGGDINGVGIGDNSGYSISISADGLTVAMGAPFHDSSNGEDSGHVRVFKFCESAWSQIGEDIKGEERGGYAGHSVSLSADGLIVAVGAPYDDPTDGPLQNADVTKSGRVKIFKWNGAAWAQRGADIDGESNGDGAGYSVELSSDGLTVALGSIHHNANGLTNAGHVRIFTFHAGSWNQLGQNIPGEASQDRTGTDIALSADGTIVAISSPFNDANNPTDLLNAGHVRVFQYEEGDGSWKQLGDDIDGVAKNDRSGHSVSLSGDGSVVVAGAIYADPNGSASGNVRVFAFANDKWDQLGEDMEGDMANDQSGFSVSISSDGQTVAVGVPLHDGDDMLTIGRVRVLQFDSSTKKWNQVGQHIDGEAGGDRTGWSVSLSSDGLNVAIGANYNDNNEKDSGYVRVMRLCSSSDSSCVTPNFCPTPSPTKETTAPPTTGSPTAAPTKAPTSTPTLSNSPTVSSGPSGLPPSCDLIRVVKAVLSG